ncbi:MAG: extracellular solute-binding protein [Nitrospinota bacterium]
MPSRRVTRIGIAAVLWSIALAPAALAAAPALQGVSAGERARVEKLIEGAKKEGELVILTNTTRPEPAAKIFEDFKRHYGLPDAKMSFTLKSSGAVISSVKADITSGRNTYDIIQVGAPPFYRQLLERGALMKYDSPHYANFIPEVTGKAPGAFAAPGYYISSYVIVAGIVWNPKHVKKDIKTWQDVLDPAHKGKIIIADIQQSETTVNFYGGVRKFLPRSYFEEVAKLDPIFVVRLAGIVRQITQGEKWIGLLISIRQAYDVAVKGVDIKSVIPPEGTVTLGYPLAILAKAPHPNLAKLWIDYVHSPDGHKTFLELQGFTSGMKGIQPSPLLASFLPPLEKTKIIPMDWDKIGENEIAAWRKEFSEIFYNYKSIP